MNSSMREIDVFVKQMRVKKHRAKKEIIKLPIVPLCSHTTRLKQKLLRYKISPFDMKNAESN